MKKTITILGCLFILLGCTQPIKVNEKSCQADTDCACGKHRQTNTCFYGNIDFVDTSKQCPDFCSGFTGQLKIKCVDNQCQQI